MEGFLANVSVFIFIIQITPFKYSLYITKGFVVNTVLHYELQKKHTWFGNPCELGVHISLHVTSYTGNSIQKKVFRISETIIHSI